MKNQMIVWFLLLCREDLNMDNINSRLNRIAEHYNLNSYSDFSKRTGIKHQTVSNYLKGKQKPDADKLAMIIIAWN